MILYWASHTAVVLAFPLLKKCINRIIVRICIKIGEAQILLRALIEAEPQLPEFVR